MKNGVDFFPLDTHIDEKLELIEAEFGIKGFGVVVRLYQWIYGRAGYYIEWTNEVALLFSHKIGEGESVVSEIVRASIQRGIFDRNIFEKYGILTSRGIQKRYFDIVKRRKDFEVFGDILLIDCDNFSEDVRKNAVFVNNLSKNANISKQSKVKESKVNTVLDTGVSNTVSGEQKNCPAPPIIELPLVDGTNYSITAEQITEWMGLYPAVDVMQQLRNMRGWLEGTPEKRKTRKGVLRFVHRWLSRAQDQGGGVKTTPKSAGSRRNVFADMLREGENLE